MVRPHAVAFLICVGISVTLGAAEQNPVPPNQLAFYNRIRQELRNSFAGQPVQNILNDFNFTTNQFNTTVKSYKMGYDGEPGSWAIRPHLENALYLATASFDPESPFKGNLSMRNASLGALGWWLEHDYSNEGCTRYKYEGPLSYWISVCPSNTSGLFVRNWWWNMIFVPQQISALCVILEEYLTSDQKLNCTRIMSRSNITGQEASNAIAMSLVLVHNGVFNKKWELIRTAYDDLFDKSEFREKNLDGPKVDGAFMQHNGQIYNGGYGQVQFNTIVKILSYGTGVPEFQFSRSQEQAFATMVVEGQQWFGVYNYDYDLSVVRGNLRTTPTGIWVVPVKGRDVPKVLESDFSGWAAKFTDFAQLKNITKQFSDEIFRTKITEAAQRMENPLSVSPLSGNRMYWSSDVMIHKRRKFTLALKMMSVRTRNGECVNGENKKPLHFSDGSLFTYTHGYDYFPAAGTWDWDLIPGISVNYQQVPLLCNGNQRFNGLKDFVGGVSDSTDGVSAMEFVSPFMKLNNLYFKKSWFFFEEISIVLVTNITIRDPQFKVFHVLDSRLLSGPITVPTTGGGTAEIPEGTAYSRTKTWIHHANVGYIFPEEVLLNVTSGNVTANLTDLLPSGPLMTNKMFTALLESQNTSGGSLYYYFLAGIGLSDFRNSVSEFQNSIVVLSNTPTLQAVYRPSHNVFGAILWVPGTVAFPNPPRPISVTSAQPCILMIKAPNNETLEISVSEPTQLLPTLQLQIVGKFSTCRTFTKNSAMVPPVESDCESALNQEMAVVTIVLPQGGFAGSTVLVRLQYGNPPQKNSNNTGLIIGLVVAGVALLGIVAMVILWTQCKSSELV